MKKFAYLVLLVLVFACAGKDGAVGPKGDKGDVGATGPKGDKGTAGENGSQAYMYDFTLDVTGSLPSYKFNTPIAADEFVLLFIRSKTLNRLIPLDGYCYDIDNRFHRVNMTYDYSGYLLFVDNATTLPAGATFSYRAIVIRAVPGSRRSAEFYQNYENVKKEFNLPD